MRLYKKLNLGLMALFYFLAGLNHFIHTDFYLKFMPPYLPLHLLLIQLSGGIEMAAAILLIPYQTRQWCSYGIIAMLISFFPANIYTITSGGAQLDVAMWFLWLRIPIQFLFMYWAYVVGKYQNEA